MTIVRPSPDDVLAAAVRIEGYVRRTPVLESAKLNKIIGGRVMIKAESIQRTGSFKVRGAFNRLLQMTPDERQRGVVAWSAGNHAQALAYVGAQLGVRAMIVMPSDAPRAKIEGTRYFGGEITFYDRTTESREEIGLALADRLGAIVVPPFEETAVIAGGGTAGLELIDQVMALGAELDTLVVCVGGGGLIAGCALAGQARQLCISVFAAEPENYDDMRRSLLAGERVENDLSHQTIADALATRTPGELTFELNQNLLTGGIAISESELRDAVRFAFDELRLVVEPGGAAALAAILANPRDFEGRTTGVILTGGNVDAEMFSSILGEVEQIGR